MQLFDKTITTIRRHYSKAAWFFIVFYAVGIAGMVIPSTNPLFVRLVPFALLLSAVALAIFHSGFSGKTLSVFILIFFLGFGAEVIGVQTGLLFGNYRYGETLGIKLFETPLIIGVNWLLLVYLTASLVSGLKVAPILQIMLAAGLMVIYDLILEQVAPVLDMWHWQDQSVPLNNYVSWFLLALIFQTLLKGFRIPVSSKIAAIVFMCQFIFFLVLWITFKT